MSNGNNNQSDKNTKRTSGIVMEGCNDIKFKNLQVSGYDVAIHLSDSFNNDFDDVKIISLEGINLIVEAQSKLQSLPLDDKIKTAISESLKDILHSQNKSGALDAYAKLMSSLSDHVTVLTPLLPLLLQIPSQFS